VVKGLIAADAHTDLEVAAGPAKRCTITTSKNAWVVLNPREKTQNGRLVISNIIKNCLELLNLLNLRDNLPKLTSKRLAQPPNQPFIRELLKSPKPMASTKLPLTPLL
jgi:hypothetical protein